MQDSDALQHLHPRIRAWFSKTIGNPTPTQVSAFQPAALSQHALISSPTGTGKSLAALAPVLSDLHHAWDAGELSDGIVCLYISPLRALNADVSQNLIRPLAEIARAMRDAGETPPNIRVSVRSADTPPDERRRQSVAPPHILITTPETLAIILGSPRMRAALARVRHIILDEIHALAGTRRGAHLSISLERVEERIRHAGGHPPRRVGLSATMADPTQMAVFLGGAREVRVVNAPMKHGWKLGIEVASPNLLTMSGDAYEHALLARIHAIIQRHRTTLVFTNTRKGAERIVAGLRAGYPEYSHALASTDSVDPAFTAPDTTDGLAPHHGSMSREGRGIVEAQLKRGDLRCVVASSSLELGIDIGSVDHVIMVGSPRDPARAVQRLGRAGHAVGATSLATLIALDPDDAIECVAVAKSIAGATLFPSPPTRAWFDVLAQHVVGIVLDRRTHPGEILSLARAAGPYAGLTADDLGRVVGALEVERLVVVDAGGRLAPGPAASRMRYMQNVGTIASRANARVRHGARYVGEVEGIFADSLVAGDVFQLAGEPWRFVRCQGNTLWANPAPGESLTLPVWLSEGLTAPSEIHASSHAHREELQFGLQRHGNYVNGIPTYRGGSNRPDLAQQNQGTQLTAEALSMTGRFVSMQRAWVGPWTAGECVVETFSNDDGRRVTVFHLPVGRRINETLGAALRTRQDPDEPFRLVVGDTGFATITPRGIPVSRASFARILASDIVSIITEAASDSERFTRREREVADRFFLTRSGASRGPPAAVQARRGRHQSRDSPLRADALWDVLHDGWDLDGARRVCAEFASGERVLGRARKVACASPFAFSILHRGEAHPSRNRQDAFKEAMERVDDGIAWRKQKEGGVAPHSLGG